MSSKHLGLGGVFLLFMAILSAAQASPGAPDGAGQRPPPPHEILLETAADLGVDSETLADIEALFEADRPRMEAAHEAARAAQDAGDAAGAEAILAAAHEEGRAVMEAALALLSPEQQEALKAQLPPPPPPPSSGRRR